MSKNINQASPAKMQGSADVSSTRRAVVNVILINGQVCSLTRDEIDNRKDWEEKLW